MPKFDAFDFANLFVLPNLFIVFCHTPLAGGDT